MADSRELFRALEFAHYAERFRGAVFVIALPPEIPFQELLLDIKVVTGYRIRVVLVTGDPGFALERTIAVANKRGARFHLSLLTDLLYRPGEGAPALDFQRVRDSLAQGRTPVIAYHGTPRTANTEEDRAKDSAGSAEGGTAPDPGQEVEPTFTLAGEVAGRLGAQKLFLVSPLTGPLREALRRSSFSAGEMDGLPSLLRDAPLQGAAPLCAFVHGMLKRGIPDVVLIEGRTADLFQEVFTYDGSGILFSAARDSRIRRAEMKDITDIGLLLRTEIEAGSILPVHENDIEAGIANYWLYEIDGMPVGLACLKPFGRDAELAQFATLPRYRGKGRARELAACLIEQARAQGFQRVFALSIDERMWEFFLGLGFQAVEREMLPEDWRRGYRMKRPSRAFLQEL